MKNARPFIVGFEGTSPAVDPHATLTVTVHHYDCSEATDWARDYFGDFRGDYRNQYVVEYLDSDFGSNHRYTVRAREVR